MQFQHSYYLFALAAIPLCYGFYHRATESRRAALTTLAQQQHWSALLQGYDFKAERHAVFTFLAALACFIVALANPQWGEKIATNRVRQADIFLVIDLSSSMLAEDIKPNRLSKTKFFAERLLENTTAERVGIIVFTDEAYLQVPLSEDYAFAKIAIENLNPEAMPRQGTSITAAIELALKSRGEQHARPLAIVLCTDGESHDDDPTNAIEKLADDNAALFVLGVGTSEGGFIPDASNAYKKDEKGNPVRTKLNSELLKKVAQGAHSQYFNLSENTPEAIDAISARIEEIGKEGRVSATYRELDSQYIYPLMLGLLLLCFCTWQDCKRGVN